MITDDRYKQLMCQVGMPNSRSLLMALQQVANEVEQACAERKDKELAALRDFSQLVVESEDFLFIRLAKSLNLIDESGNPTPLLTGKPK